MSQVTSGTEISELLKKNKERILETWEERVRERIPEAKSHDKAAIRNTLPDLFDKMIETLAKEPPKRTASIDRELDIWALPIGVGAALRAPLLVITVRIGWWGQGREGV